MTQGNKSTRAGNYVTQKIKSVICLKPRDLMSFKRAESIQNERLQTSRMPQADNNGFGKLRSGFPLTARVFASLNAQGSQQKPSSSVSFPFKDTRFSPKAQRGRAEVKQPNKN